MVNFTVLYDGDGYATIVKEYRNILGKRVSKVYKDYISVEEAAEYEDGKKDYFTKLEEIKGGFNGEERKAQLEYNEKLLRQYRGVLFSKDIMSYIIENQELLLKANEIASNQAEIFIRMIEKSPVKEMNFKILEDLKKELESFNEIQNSGFIKQFKEYKEKISNVQEELKYEIEARKNNGLLSQKEYDSMLEGLNESTFEYFSSIKTEVQKSLNSLGDFSYKYLSKIEKNSLNQDSNLNILNNKLLREKIKMSLNSSLDYEISEMNYSDNRYKLRDTFPRHYVDEEFLKKIRKRQTKKADVGLEV